jgi:hypothetical protein
MGAASAGAWAAEPGAEELKRQIEALKARVQTLEAQSAPEQAAGATADTGAAAGEPAAATVDSVLRDADRRSQLLADGGGGLTAGWDKGFFLKSEDGKYSLKPGIQLQFRNVTNYRQDAAQGGDKDDVENGFEVRRLRFRFDGNAFSPKFTYSFVFDASRTNGAVTLLDGWGQYAFTPNLALRFGQFKESVFHERDVSGFQQLAVDRSLADQVLGGNITDRVQGLSLIYGGSKENPVRAEFAVHDGANSKNTNFQDGATGTHWGVGARGEYKFFGDWASYKDLTAKGTKQNLFVLGAGADYTDRVGNDVLLTTVDAQYELTRGLVVYGALHANVTDPHDSTDNRSRVDYGALVQAGYAIGAHWEPFARYDVVKLDEDALDAGDEDTFHEITVGANYYLGPDGSYLHRAKISLDLTYLPSGAPSDQTGSGILAGDDNQFVVRGQFQLLL